MITVHSSPSRHLPVSNAHTIPLPAQRKRHKSLYAGPIKRTLDIVISACSLIILTPFLLLPLYIILRVTTGSSPIFRQTRIGLHRKPFQIIKFKTMTDERDASGKLLSDELRTTKLGAFLRSTSLDEFPELINVLKGDMSFVGPRPWIPEQMENFSHATQKRRMDIRPGITGLAQIQGRNNLTFRQRICFDLDYVRNTSFDLDVVIFFRTFHKVFKREGIKQCSNALLSDQQGIPPKDAGSRDIRSNDPTHLVNKDNPPKS